MKSADLARALARDPAAAEVSASDRAMLDYAATLTLTPHEIREADIERLRDVGFEDAGILDICQVVSYYNYVNRLADGLGVTLEPEWTDDDMILTREEFENRRRSRHDR
jgi:uncharacterized peroxidase-related enzyme